MDNTTLIIAIVVLFVLFGGAAATIGVDEGRRIYAEITYV